MSVQRDSQGEIVFTTDEDKEIEGALKEIFNTTEVGQGYKKNYYIKARCDEDYDKLVAAAIQITGGPFICGRHLQHALTLLIDSGEIKPKNFTPAAKFEEPEEDTRPRDRNGKLLSEAQIAWSSMRQFAETASMAEINRRKASDPEFANFVRKNLEREMSQEIGDAVVPAGAPQSKARVNQTLVDFARKYNAEPSQNLKPRGGFILLAGEQVPYSQFLELVNAATNARLL
jgi:hypothetical protein